MFHSEALKTSLRRAKLSSGSVLRTRAKVSSPLLSTRCRTGSAISSAIRQPGFGDWLSFGRPFGKSSRYPDTPPVSISPRRRFPRPTPERVLVADHQSGSGFSGTVPTARHLGQLEGDVPAVADHLGADLHELLAQRRERLVCHLLRQS